MATQIPNNTNINDVIKSSIKNLKDTTKILKIIIGEVDDIVKNIPYDLDQYSVKLDSISKIMNNYLGLIQKIPSLSKINEDDLKSSYKIALTANDYYKNFAELLDSLSELSYSYNYKQTQDFINIVNKVLESLSSVSELPKFNIRQLIRTKLYLVEYEWMLNELMFTYNKLVNKYDSIDTSNIVDSIDNLYNIINSVDEGEYSTLVSAPFKAALIQTAIIDILSVIKIVNTKLSGKTLLKNLDIAENSAKSLIEITNSLLEVIDNLSQISKHYKQIKLVQNTLLLLPDIFESISKISKTTKNIKIDNNDILRIVDFTKNLIKIEKQVILIGLLSIPFAAASLLSLVMVSIGMLALQGLMYIILFISNPVVIKAVVLSIRRLTGVMMMIALAITALALTVVIMLMSHEMIVNNLSKILQTILCIGIVIFAIIGLGWIMTISSPLIAAAVAGIAFIGLSLLAIIGISLLLSQIPKFDISDKKDLIINSVKSITDTAKSVINEILGAFDDKMGSNGTKYGDDGLVLTASKWILGDTFTNMIKLIFMSSILIFTVISTGLIIITSMILNLLISNNNVTNVVANGKKITEKVKSIMGTSKNVINEVFKFMDNPISDGGDGVLLGVAGLVLGDMVTNMFKLIISCISLTFTVIAVAMVKMTAITLSTINNITFNSDTVVTNTQTIMSTAKRIIGAVNSPIGNIEESKQDKPWHRDLLEFALPSGLVNMIDSVMAIGTLAPTMVAVGAIGFMASSINSINKVTIDSSVETKSKNIILMGSRLIKLINDQDAFGLFDNAKAVKRISILKDLSDVISGFSKDIKIQDHTKAVDNIIRFTDSINNVKLENLKTAVNMFKQMKEFSESINGNFEGLANSLNEKIAPLLEELKDLISKIPESVDKSASTISGSVYQAQSITNGTANAVSMEAQITKENPSMSKEEINKIVDQRMTDQTQTVNRGIEMKLDELMEILQNYSNPMPVRLT